MSNGHTLRHGRQAPDGRSARAARRGRWVRVLALLLPVASVAATIVLYLRGPDMCRLYFLYALAQLSQPLVLLFLVLTVATLSAAILLRYRHKPEFLAFCFLLSAVAHLLAIAFFSLWIVRRQIVEFAAKRGRHEIVVGPPSFFENIVGQKLRERLLDISPQDDRNLETRNEHKPVDELRTPPKGRPDLPDDSLPAPERETIPIDQIGRQQQPVDEVLAELPAGTPERDTTKLAMVEQIESAAPEAEPEPSPDRELQAEPKTDTFRPAEELLAKPQADDLKKIQQTHRPSPVEMAQIEPTDPAVQEELHNPKTDEPVTPLDIQTIEEPITRSAARPDEAVPESPADVSLERAELPTQAEPLAAPEALELDPELERSSPVRLEESVPSAVERSMDVADTGISLPGRFRRPIAEPLQVADRRPVLPAAQGAGNREPQRRVTARDVQTGRQQGQLVYVAKTPARLETALPNVQADPGAVLEAAVPARQEQGLQVSETLNSAGTVRPRTETDIPVGAAVEALAAAPGAEPSQPGSPLPRETLQAARRSPAAPHDESSTLMARRRATGTLPEARVRNDVSLASAGRLQTAKPSVVVPAVAGALTPRAESVMPTGVVVNIGGRFMIVEQVPARVAAGRPVYRARQALSAGRPAVRDQRSRADDGPARFRAPVARGSTAPTVRSSMAETRMIRVAGRTMSAPDDETLARASTALAAAAAVPVTAAVRMETPRPETARPRTGRTRESDRDLTHTRATRPHVYSGSLSGHVPPPPRATFLDNAARRSVTGSLVPLEQGATAGRRNAGPTDDTVGPATDTSRSMASLSLPVAVGQEQEVASHPAPAAGAVAAPGRLSVARARAGRQDEPERSGRLSALAPPKARLSDRAPGRIDVADATGTASGPKIEDDTDGVAGHAASVRALIAAELAALRDSPSKKAIYQLRAPGKRKQYIAELGGSVETENAVEQALAWLSEMQSDDGRWDVDGFKGVRACGGRGDQVNADVGLTGLSLLAFLGAGYTHTQGAHKDTVKKGLDWLISGLEDNGDLRRGGQMYDHAMATAALCESLSLTEDQAIRPVARRAVTFILNAQNPGAAWRYNPREDNDTSVTGWQILALKSAEVAGIPVPPQHYRWTHMWLDEVRKGETGGLYSYRTGHAVTPVMTAEGWFCQLFMGEQSRTRGQDESIEHLMQHLPVWAPEIPGAVHFYYWYYATLALHLSGAEEFGRWNDALTAALMKGRITEGPAAGSWDPVSHLGTRGGRVYTTAAATLCLEVYYRYLPFYKLK